MKYIISLVILFFSATAFAQIDSANQNITVQLPQKAISLFGYKLKTDYNWADRKVPDQLVSFVGSGNQPDSLVTVVVKAGTLADFLGWMLSQPYGAIGGAARSILSNSPSITGYTALTTQVTTKANGNTSEKAAAQYTINRYNAYANFQTNQYNQALQAGTDWIKN